MEENKKSKPHVVEYEVEFIVKIKHEMEYPEKRFTDGCPHPSTIADWIIEDIEEDFEDKGYEVVGFNKMSFKNVDKVKE